jgi:hypothetical protein
VVMDQAAESECVSEECFEAAADSFCDSGGGAAVVESQRGPCAGRGPRWASSGSEAGTPRRRESTGVERLVTGFHDAAVPRRG